MITPITAMTRALTMTTVAIAHPGHSSVDAMTRGDLISFPLAKTSNDAKV